MKDHIVKGVKLWNGTENMCSLSLDGFSEPIDYRYDTVPRAGQKLFGEVVPYQTASGTTRQKFTTQETRKVEDTKQVEINTSWAIQTAIQIAPDYDKDTIKQTAYMLLQIKEEMKENK